MDATLRIASFLLGFSVFILTGNVILPLGAGILWAISAKLTKLNWLQQYGYLGLGVLTGLHTSTGDPVALILIGLGIVSLGQRDQLSKNLGVSKLIVATIIFAGLASGYHFCLIAGVGAGLIIADIRLPGRLNKLLPVALAISYGSLVLCVPSFRNGKSVYLEQGKWATDSGDYGGNNKPLSLRNETTYSYSWMVRTIADRKGSPLSLGPNDDTAWLVTPTLPLTEEETLHLTSWVHRGGRLVVIADHTDYVGHTRCLNQLTERMHLKIHLGAFLPEVNQIETTTSLLGRDTLTKTPTIATAVGAVPILTARGYFEAPDYSKAGFFGPCTPSVDDKYGRFMTGGTVRHGLGSLTYWGDSTLFSNFSIFQPDSIDTLAILDSRAWATLPALACFILFLITIIGRSFLALVISTTLIALIPRFSVTREGLLSKHANVAWAGDKNLVDDRYDPKASFSTLYALSSATGKVPRWTDEPEKELGGIWVGESPPPNANWRWLSPFLGIEFDKDDGNNVWAPIVKFVNPEALYTKKITKVFPDKADAGGLWTNEGIGSWWFGMGTSTVRTEKIAAALKWLISGSSDWNEPARASYSGKSMPCTVIIDDGKTIHLSLPRINGEPGEYVYLGAGVSALITNLDGRRVLSGARDKDCFGYANSMKQSSWVMFYDEDLPPKKK